MNVIIFICWFCVLNEFVLFVCNGRCWMLLFFFWVYRINLYFIRLLLFLFVLYFCYLISFFILVEDRVVWGCWEGFCCCGWYCLILIVWSIRDGSLKFYWSFFCVNKIFEFIFLCFFWLRIKCVFYDSVLFF